MLTRIPILFLLFAALPINGIAETPSLADAKRQGTKESAYHKAVEAAHGTPSSTNATPVARLDEFRADILPVLQSACVQCHGPDKQKADFRVDTLDPDLLTGEDVSWWLEVVDVMSTGDMPPSGKKAPKLADADRGRVIDWLSEEIQVASQVRRAGEGHSSFRRLTRYETNYALQDLLGLPYDFAKDLPPETASEDGFKNSSEMLHVSTSQFEMYREIARKALERATVRGERPPEKYYELVGMRIAEVPKNKPTNEKAAYYLDRSTGNAIARADNNYRHRPLVPITQEEGAATTPNTNTVLVLPGKHRVSWPLGIDLPEHGDIHLRIRASRPHHTVADKNRVPTLRVLFGFQPSNNSQITVRTPTPDFDIDSPPGGSRIYECTIPLSEIARNPYRGKRLPKLNSSESIILLNVNPDVHARVQIESIEVTTPGFTEWPPASHRRVFPENPESKEGGESTELSDPAYREHVLQNFMRRAWKRTITAAEIDRKLKLYDAIRPTCEDDQEAMVEVLSTVLSSPHFLYLLRPAQAESNGFATATRLSAFLWSSLPDTELLQLAEENKLDDPDVLANQVDRMLADPRANRFHRHFVRQWLGMDLLDHLRVDPKVAPRFNDDLHDAMGEEPIAFFRELLTQNQSILDFLHADFRMLNEPLAKHYGMPDAVKGLDFQRVSFPSTEHATRHGGLLAQAGLLAMNSDGKDSHPLKRGIWLLEKILNDPPPPPPPSVPEIDIADPEIAKLTLKERMEDHRNDPACMSCHQRIDPWGVAFENFDAVGRWRSTINKKPIDATSTLFNQQELAGIEGLKRYLLLDRQDQFARALTHKLAAYALGRPIHFADHAALETITTRLRQEGDGLRTLVHLLVTSDLFGTH